MSDTLHRDDILEFPEGFWWGSGISSHQVEGGNRNNDWWAFETRDRITGGDRSGQACDHYHRYETDFRHAADLGQNTVKISVEWSRVEPRPGEYDETELEHYAAVVESMRDVGLQPIVVLHHFTNPMWLEGYGWWDGAQVPAMFSAYCRVVAARLAGSVDTWITINEPMLLATAGYVFGVWPPERRSLPAGRRVARNLVTAHRLAYDAVHDVAGVCRVGPAINVTALKHPGKPTVPDRLLGGPLDWLANHYFLDSVCEHADFIGVQYYSRATVAQLLSGDPLAVPRGMRRLPKTDMGWEIYPKGLYYMVRDVWRRCELPIVVTENGIADASDTKRAQFIRDHLVWLHRAIEEGVDVRGYLYWSLMDNFEWREGFKPRFGLLEVDYESQARTVRESARFYERVCRTNSVPATAAGMLR